ncbi:hypothetical protein LguiA_010912 [Lonicera macranthoides]
MRGLLEAIAEVPFSGVSILRAEEEGGHNQRFYNWIFDCHGFFHNVALIVPSAMFVLYLAFQAKKSFAKLSNGRSYIMIAYYGFVWLVSLLNLAWCALQAWECTLGKEVQWNVLSLFTSSGMLFLEVSLMAFLLQGNYASGLEALTRTFLVSGLVVGLDILLKLIMQHIILIVTQNSLLCGKASVGSNYDFACAVTWCPVIYLFAFGIPLFIDNNEETHRVKWGLWVVHKLLLTAVYGFILCMYNSKWRERLPAKPAFYKYIIVMFCLNTIALFACVLTGHRAGFGFWLYDVTVVCYHAFYLPLLYVTFLADFFQEEDLHLDNVYYSEMKDAGFFDADWE